MESVFTSLKWNGTRWVNIAVTVAVAAVMLGWGVFALLFVSPNGETAIAEAVLRGQRVSDTVTGLVVTPGSESQVTLWSQTTIQPGVAAGTYGTSPNLVLGPFLWTQSNSTLTTRIVLYFVFSYNFSTPLGNGPEIWFSGPSGNLTAAVATSRGLSTLSGNYPTLALEPSSPGNYTLHYVNRGSTSATGGVALGTSYVAYSRPYLYLGLATLMVAAASTIVVAYVSLRKRVSRQSAST